MYMRADVVLFVALLQNPLLQCSSQSIFVHWDKATDGFVRPQLNGIDKPANSPFALEPTANRTEENLLASHWHIPSNIIISSVYNGTLNMSDSPVLDGLASKKLKSICAAENISCTSCWNKNHYKSAILQHIHSISIRSLKNFLAVRGLRCHECKTKADLERIAVYGAHLPHRKFVLPAVMIPNFWLFPRGTLKLNILEPQFQFMLRLIEQQGDQRFALLPTKNVGIIARVTKLEYPTDGQVEVQIVGEQRFRAEGSLWTLAGHFAQDVALVNGTLLTDQPVPAAATAELRVADKGARRAFFWLDTDRWAARRAETLLGSPPPESDGPEALSHWLGMALNEPRLQAEMFVSNSTAARLALARAALDYFRAALPGSQAAANWTGTLKPLSLPGPAQDTLPSSTSKKETSAEPVNAATVSQEERAASREEKAAAREAKAAAAAEKEKAAAAQKKVAAPVQKEREKPAAVAQKKTDAAAARAAATEQKEKPKKEKASASASAQKDNENASTVQKDKEKVSAAAAAAEQGEKPTKEKKAAAAQSKREKGATAQKEKERAETAQKVTEKSSSSSSSAAAVAGAAEKGKEKPQKENEKRAQKAMSAATAAAQKKEKADPQPKEKSTVARKERETPAAANQKETAKTMSATPEKQKKSASAAQSGKEKDRAKSGPKQEKEKTPAAENVKDKQKAAPAQKGNATAAAAPAAAEQNVKEKAAVKGKQDAERPTPKANETAAAAAAAGAQRAAPAPAKAGGEAARRGRRGLKPSALATTKQL